MNINNKLKFFIVLLTCAGNNLVFLFSIIAYLIIDE